jgi:hypothetical protein
VHALAHINNSVMVGDTSISDYVQKCHFVKHSQMESRQLLIVEGLLECKPVGILKAAMQEQSLP